MVPLPFAPQEPSRRTRLKQLEDRRRPAELTPYTVLLDFKREWADPEVVDAAKELVDLVRAFFILSWLLFVILGCSVLSHWAS